MSISQWENQISISITWVTLVSGASGLCIRDRFSGAQLPVGSVGDSCDNALAETIIGLYKTEVIHRCGPWRNLEAVEHATLEWVDWFNYRRLLEPIGNVPPAELEVSYYQSTGQMPNAA